LGYYGCKLAYTLGLIPLGVWEALNHNTLNRELYSLFNNLSGGCNASSGMPYPTRKKRIHTPSNMDGY